MLCVYDYVCIATFGGVAREGLSSYSLSEVRFSGREELGACSGSRMACRQKKMASDQKGKAKPS